MMEYVEVPAANLADYDVRISTSAHASCGVCTLSHSGKVPFRGARLVA